MNTKELGMALRALSFLDSHAADPSGVLELRGRPHPRLLVWHPDAIGWIHRSDQQLRHAGSRTLTRMLGQRSLLFTDGPRHAAYRRALGPLLRGDQLAGYRGTVSRTVHAAIDELTPGTVISLPGWTRRVTLRIIGQIVLDRADDAVLGPFSAWIDHAMGSPQRALADRFLRTHAWWPAAWRPRPVGRRTLDTMLLGSAKAAAREGRPTMATRLLDGGVPLGPLDDGELRDQLASLLFAGHETTASATAWTLYWLDRHDDVRRDVVAELTATADDGAQASEVPLLHAAVQEALRLSPPATVTVKRVLPADGELLGRALPAGTVLTPCVYLAHHQPDQFPRPHRFDPARFLGGRVPSTHYFPFGGGVRYCLGRSLALMEIRMITAALLRRRELRCVDPRAGVPRLRGAAMAPSPRLRMVVAR